MEGYVYLNIKNELNELNGFNFIGKRIYKEPKQSPNSYGKEVLLIRISCEDVKKNKDFDIVDGECVIREFFTYKDLNAILKDYLSYYNDKENYLKFICISDDSKWHRMEYDDINCIKYDDSEGYSYDKKYDNHNNCIKYSGFGEEFMSINTK